MNFKRMHFFFFLALFGFMHLHQEEKTEVAANKVVLGRTLNCRASVYYFVNYTFFFFCK